jgi:hypothetical protein
MRSGIEGSSRVEYSLDGKINTLIKNSNFFDAKKNYQLGTFSLPASKAEGPIKSLESLVLKVAELKSQPPIKPHEAVFVLDGKKIGRDSPMFKTIGKVFAELQSLPWVLQDGVVYSEDMKSKSLIKNSKIVAEENFDFKFYCKNSSRPTYCLDKNYGILYVE